MIRLFDCGGDGLMVPMVDTADQARPVVETILYTCPPGRVDPSGAVPDVLATGESI